MRLMKTKTNHRLLLASEQYPTLQPAEESNYSEAAEVVKIIKQGIIRCCNLRSSSDMPHGEFPSINEFAEKNPKNPELVLQYESALLCGIDLCLEVNEIDQAKLFLVLFNTKTALSAEKAFYVFFFSLI
jgi:hypothetical protein